MKAFIGLGLCVALTACAGRGIEPPPPCRGEPRPANPYGITLPSVTPTATVEDAGDVNVFQPDDPPPVDVEVPELDPTLSPDPNR